MPFIIKKLLDGHFQVINEDTGKIYAKHTTLKNAKSQVRLLLATEHGWKPSYGGKTFGEKERDKGLIYYQFLVCIDLFSRFAFVKLWRIGNKKGEVSPSELETIKYSTNEINDMPTVEKKGILEDLEDDGIVDNLPSDRVLAGIKEIFSKINKKGFDNVSYFITDQGKEFMGKIPEWLKSQNTIYGTTVPNDRVANPIAERMIQTFKRLFGQYCAMKGSYEIDQNDVNEIMNFYNSRIHSSTGYAPKDVLDGISMKDDKVSINDEENVAPILFDFYRHQKGDMYYNMMDEIPKDSIVRINTKWLSDDDNLGDYKTNINSWSYTLYKVKGINRKTNFYLIEPLDGIDKRDKKVKQPGIDGMRRENLQVIDYQAFKDFNIKK